MKNLFSAILCFSFVLITLAACTEVELASHVVKTGKIAPDNSSQGAFKVGNPYKIAGKTYRPQETYNYEQTGIASWYGPQFHGKKTANGETFDMYELTAAHKTLQMPSLVRVTNLDNGHSIIVRVNDRGPFSKGRIIDVSKRSAELLGFKDKGTAKVKLQVLAEESRQVAEAAKRGESTRGVEVAMNKQRYEPIAQRSAPPVARPAVATAAPVPQVEVADIQTSIPGHVNQGRFYPDAVVKQLPVSPTNIYVQAGSFGNIENAQRLALSLQEVGTTQIQQAVISGQNFYRVRIGPLQNVPQADSILGRLSSIGQNNAIVVVD